MVFSVLSVTSVVNLGDAGLHHREHGGHRGFCRLIRRSDSLTPLGTPVIVVTLTELMRPPFLYSNTLA
jgi:hypothetical protein